MEIIEKLEKAASIHNATKEFIIPYIKEDIDTFTLCNLIEDKIRELSPKDSLNNSIAFPTGISLNNVAAHYTPTKNDSHTIRVDDVIKIDYGVHNDGYIIDSAFTINLNNKYDVLLKASYDAISNVIKNIGVDTKFSELSNIIEEVVNSYEYENNGKLIPVKIIDNLYGHNIKQWNIHAGKYLYPTKKENDNQIVEDGEIMAVEVFTSNGDGITILDENISNFSHYNLKSEFIQDRPIPLFQNKKLNILSKVIKDNFKTLPFCPRYINNNRKQYETYASITSLQQLFSSGILNSYPPLIETDISSKIAQFEHTIYVSENSKIDFNDF